MPSACRLYLFIICFLFWVQSSGQSGNLIFHHITRGSGLPTDKVTALAQDSSGFIWIGSDEGLYRFDGFNFLPFQTGLDKGISLPDHFITKIHVDRHGKIWVGSFHGGLACLQTDGTVIQQYNSKLNSNFNRQSDIIGDIAEDKNGTIWIATEDGLFSIHSSGKSVQRHERSPGVYHPNNRLGSISFDHKGRLWLSSFTGPLIFDPVLNRFYDKKNNPDKISLLDDFPSMKSMILLPDLQKAWYSNWMPSIKVWHGKEDTTEQIYHGIQSTQPDYNRLVNQFYRTKDGSLWMATGRGLLKSDKSCSFIEQTYRHEGDNPYSILLDDVNAIVEDREGTLWIGTNSGISRARFNEKSVNNFSVNTRGTLPFSDKEVNNIIVLDSTNYLVGTHYADGYWLTDPSFRPKKHYTFNTFKWDWAWTHYRDEERKRIYISTQEGTLLYHTNRYQFEVLKQAPFDSLFPFSAFTRQGDWLWMARFRNHLVKYNLHTGQWKTYQLIQMGTPSQVLNTLIADKNYLWIACSGSGLMVFDILKEKIVRDFNLKPPRNGPLLQPEVRFISDMDSLLFIGYETAGFSLYNKERDSIFHFNRQQGLISNTLRCIMRNGEDVWIGTANGISRFHLPTRTFSNYGFEQGIVSGDISTITPLPDGSIAAGTMKGLFVLKPQYPGSVYNPPVPLLTRLDLYGRKISADSLLQTNAHLVIPYNENYFSFEYISPFYTNPALVEYAYLLEGLDRDWIMAGNRRFASYSNMKGGNYTLRIKARIQGGNWVEMKQPLVVKVQTAFYKQWWFYVICTAIALIIIYILFRYRLQQLLKIEKMRSSISADLHDEVGASLTSISLFSEMAKRSVPAASQAEQYLQRIGERSRDSIEQMSDIIWSINPGNDTLSQLTAYMKNYVNEVAEAKNINVHWQESGTEPVLKLSMEQRKNLYLLFKETVNNAVKHSGASEIIIRLEVSRRKLKLKIKDNGCGFSQERMHGNGLKNIQKRAAALKGNASIVSEVGTGTAMLLEFPLH